MVLVVCANLMLLDVYRSYYYFPICCSGGKMGNKLFFFYQNFMMIRKTIEALEDASYEDTFEESGVLSIISVEEVLGKWT